MIARVSPERIVALNIDTLLRDRRRSVNTLHHQPRPLHPLNAALRFVLELVALSLFGRWGYTCGVGAMSYVWMLALPLVAAALWGTFSVPGDPSRGKHGPVRVSGAARLALEAIFFGAAVAACYAASNATWALMLGAVICLHYGWAQARTRWLLTQ
jgi:hypothetical protein